MAKKKVEKEEEDFEIDFSGIKNFFKGKKEAKKQEDDEEDFNIDFSKAKDWVVKNKRFTYPIGTALLIIIACFFVWQVRVQAVPNYDGRILPDLDTYIFLRYAKQIVGEGLVANDTLRHYPIGFDTSQELLSPSYSAAILYWVANFLGQKMSIVDASIYYPPLATVISIIFFFFFVKEVFKSKKIAFVSSMLLGVMTGYLYRTSAGVIEKEAIAMMFLFALAYFVFKSINEKKIIKKIVYGLFAGASLTLSALSWGGVAVIFVPLGIAFIISIIFKISKRSDSITYFLLTLASLATSLFTTRFGIGFDILKHYLFLFFPIALLLNLYYYEIYPKVSRFIIKYKPKNLPEHYYILLIGAAAILLITPIFPGISFYQKILAHADSIINPVGDAFSNSVSELQAPYFISSSGADWWSGLNYNFFTMMIGAFLLFYSMLKKFKKQRVIFSIVFILLMLAFIFSRFSDSQEYSSFNEFFATRIFGLELHYLFIIIFLAYAIYFIIKNNKKIEEFSEIKMEYLFIFFYFFLSAVTARMAVRMIFSVCPVAAILSGYAFEKISQIFGKIIKHPKIAYAIIGIAFALIFYYNYTISYNSNKSIYPPFTYEWDEAMLWVKANTTNTSVFTHWWDYGYWVQTMGERATTLDGGNYYVNRDHLTGRYLFASRIYQNGTYNMTEPATHLALDFAKPDYFLIVDDDVLKYVQMGRIGKRPTYYTVGTFSEEIDNQLNLDNSTIYPKLLVFNSIYGAYPVQEDFVYNNFIFKKESTYIVAIIYPYNPSNGTISSPYAYIYNPYITNNYIILPFNGQCVLNEGCFTYRTNSVREYPLLLKDGVVLITENASDNLFTYLYLLNMSVPGFEIAYDNERPLTVQGMVNSGLTDIKIYKINYTELEPWILDEKLPDYWSVSGDAFW